MSSTHEDDLHGSQANRGHEGNGCPAPELHQLPDLARARAFADRLRAADDQEAADLLASDEGQWFFAEATPYTDVATRFRVVRLVTRVVPRATMKEIFMAGPDAPAGES